MLTRPAAVALLVLCASGVAHTRQAAREQKPVKEHTFDLESSYIRMPLPPGDEKYGRLDGYRMKDHVRAITAITRKYHDAGERYWGRLPGSKADSDTEQYIAARFKDYGLAVEMQPVSLTPQWRATDWSFTATGSGTTLTPTSIYPAEDTFNTPAGGLNLDVVWVGLGTELDFAGRDVKGKLVFVHSDPRPNAFQGTARSIGAMQRAVQQGAAAVVVNVNIPGNITQTFATAPKVPTFSIGTRDADDLKALMTKGPVTVSLKMAAEARTGLTDNNVWGTLPGTSPEEIIITAHHDSRFEGAFDNASGIATMLGLAEYFSKVPQAQRKRTMRFVSTATNQEGANAVKARPGGLSNVVLVINSEHTAITAISQFGASGSFKTTATSPRRWWINGSDKLAAMTFDAYKKFGVAIWDWEMYDGGGIGPFAREVTSLQLLDSPVYHSAAADRDDNVPPPGLEAVARAYAKIIDQTGTMSRAEMQQSLAAPASR
jgi:hypothetical protein